MRCCCYWEKNQYRNIYFASIKLALHKCYHLRMCNRVLLWFRGQSLWNHHVSGTIFESGLRSQVWPQWNCHVNGTTCQHVLRFQTGLSSLRVSCKRAPKHQTPVFRLHSPFSTRDLTRLYYLANRKLGR